MTIFVSPDHTRIEFNPEDFNKIIAALEFVNDTTLTVWETENDDG